MNTSLYIASTGVRAFQGKMDNIANNIANVDTTGYKRREATFSDNLAVSIQNQTEQQKENGRTSPPGIRTTFGSRIAATTLDATQGTPLETNNPFDFMIVGDGYFQVQRTTGNTTETLYTRNGVFQQMALGNGRVQLVNSQGDILLDQNGKPIELNSGENFQVITDGTIAGSSQKMAIMTIENPQLLTDEGGVSRLIGGTVSLANSVNLKQGYLESSNVDLNKEMTDMIKAQRGLQANARALSYADQMLGIANGIMRT
ncbi:flagellar hook-basal body protein [Neobacillus sp. NPDC093127]|uniref:flagellar hook-basal body protein n=1 Tax=Neobacillus sp. NPDC093127 TaxID=3364296 RepID=UPI00381A35B9